MLHHEFTSNTYVEILTVRLNRLGLEMGRAKTRLGSGWAGLLGGLGYENYRALARRSGLARLA
jgi:hypothetical protein